MIKILKTAFLFYILLINLGCNSPLRQNFTDLSGQAEYKDWIGRKFRLSKEVFIVKNWQYCPDFLCKPGFGLPTLDDFKNKGITKEGMTSNWKVIKIVPAGTIFEIEAIGKYSFNSMIGPRSLVFVRDVNNNEYVTEELFDVGWIAPIMPHSSYITDLDGNYFPVKMNKGWEDFQYPVKIKAETYQEFYQRLTKEKRLAFYITSSKRIVIKFEKIDKDNIDNISVFYENSQAGCEQKITARKATVNDLGNGKAELLLVDALIEKGQERQTTANKISIVYDYNGTVIQE